VEPIPDQTLCGFLDSLAAPGPTAGAGAAAAVALAMAAACAAKAMGLAAKQSQDDEALGKAVERARWMASIALEGAQRDADDFRAWLKNGAPAQAEVLWEEGRALLGLADELSALIGAAKDRVPAAFAGDLSAAEALIEAFAAIQARNLDELAAESA
jgi:hypothetical protein